MLGIVMFCNDCISTQALSIAVLLHACIQFYGSAECKHECLCSDFARQEDLANRRWMAGHFWTKNIQMFFFHYIPHQQMSFTIEHWAFELFNLDHSNLFSAIFKAIIKEQIKEESFEGSHPNVYYILTNTNHVRTNELCTCCEFWKVSVYESFQYMDSSTWPLGLFSHSG